MDIREVDAWMAHRNAIEKMNWRDAGAPGNPTHNVVHVAKALGSLAAVVEGHAHGESRMVEEKRAADLIIHAVWLARSLGLDPDRVVRERIVGFADGFLPVTMCRQGSGHLSVEDAALCDSLPKSQKCRP